MGGLPASNATTYVVDLDAPAESRWRHVIEDHVTAVRATAAFLKQAIPPKALPIVEEIAGLLDGIFPVYGGEMRGISTAAGMPLGEIVLLNLLYSVTVSCTSVVASSTDGSHILHSRNLDYDLPNVLRPLVVEVDFVRAGAPAFRATIFAGAVGVLTGVSPGGVSISIDERDTHNSTLLDNLAVLLLDRASRPVTFLARDVLQGSNQPGERSAGSGGVVPFDRALESIVLTPILAPCYMILGGTKGTEGAVVTRDRLTARDVWRIDRSGDGWYRAETNYDHWVPAPARDDRRKYIYAAMNSMTQGGLSAPHLVDAMQVFPVLRSSTIYNTVMSATTGEIRTYLRNSTRKYP